MDCLPVDDEPQPAQLPQRRLTRAGFQVEWVTSVSTAVGALLQRPYAVVLLDIVLKQGRGRPDQYGLDVAREMRRLGIVTPVVVMTAFPTFEHGLEAGALTPVAVLEKGTDPRPIVEACQAAAAAAALTATADPLERAREDVAALDLSRSDAADRCSALLLRAIGHPALTLFQARPLSRELGKLATFGVVPDIVLLRKVLATSPSSGDSEVDLILTVLAAGPVPSNAALANAIGSSVRAIRERLNTVTHIGPAEWRCLARGKRLVGRLINTRDNIGQCADAAGYPYGRQSVPECRRLFGRTPTQIRQVLRQR
ncbi:MAG: response regulator [Acidobacteria bacterium]|nr:response regulator [Acidobacteriota bacterium]